MPTTIAALIIILVCVFPGVLGDRVYRTLVGIDWREKDFRAILRLIGFSLIGAVFYSVVAGFLNWPPPLHLFPFAIEALSSDPKQINSIILPYIGHLIGSIFAGFTAARGTKLLAKLSPGSDFTCAWDAFVRKYAPGHWVIVGLTSGESYAGILKHVDVSVSPTDRDLILEEPCQYDEKSKNYKAINYQFLFIPANTISSLAAVHEPTQDKKMIPIGEDLFKGA
jgi:hypothetical protein